MIPNTAELQALTRPYLDLIIKQLGTTVEIVRTVTDPIQAPSLGDEWGRPIDNPVTPNEIAVNETCYIYQLPEETRVNFTSAGGSITIPDWEAIFRITAPIAVPGFKIRYQNRIFTPVNPAEDMGNQGIGWRVRLLSPEQRGGVS